MSLDASQVLNAIVNLFQKILYNPIVRRDFLATFSLRFLLPYLEYCSPLTECEELRVIILGLYAVAINKLDREEDVDCFLLEFSPAAVAAGSPNICDGGLFDHLAVALKLCTSEVGKMMVLSLIRRLLQSTLLLHCLQRDRRRLEVLVWRISYVAMITAIRYLPEDKSTQEQCTDSSEYTTKKSERENAEPSEKIKVPKRTKRMIYASLDCLQKLLCGTPSMEPEMSSYIPEEFGPKMFCQLFHAYEQKAICEHPLWRLLKQPANS